MNNSELQGVSKNLLEAVYHEFYLIKNAHEYRSKMLGEITLLVNEMTNDECLELLYIGKSELLDWVSSDTIADGGQRSLDLVFESAEYCMEIYHKALNTSEKVDINKMMVHADEICDITVCDSYDWTLKEFFEEYNFEYTDEYVVTDKGEKVYFDKLGDLKGFVEGYRPEQIIEHEIWEDETEYSEEEEKNGFWEQTFFWDHELIL